MIDDMQPASMERLQKLTKAASVVWTKIYNKEQRHRDQDAKCKNFYNSAISQASFNLRRLYNMKPVKCIFKGTKQLLILLPWQVVWKMFLQWFFSTNFFLWKFFLSNFFWRNFFFSQEYFFCIWCLRNNVFYEIFYLKFCLLQIFCFVILVYGKKIVIFFCHFFFSDEPEYQIWKCFFSEKK